MFNIKIDLVFPNLGFAILNDDFLLQFNEITFNIPCVLEDDSLKALKDETEEVPELVQSARTLLEKNGANLCPDGVGGTYFIKGLNGKIESVFKPIDEEPGAVNNPKDLLADPLLPPGGGAKREIAAFLLDKGHAGVPETFYISKLKSPVFHGGDLEKEGSLQRYIENIGNASSFGTSLFPTQDVHNIGILDLRLLNLDRNEENILLVKQGDNLRLVPIDHTYSLPPTLDNLYFEWMHWKQAKVPFSPETLSYIQSLDPLADAVTLRSLGIEEEAIENMIYSTLLLKKAAQEGKNLFEIASMVCRKRMSEPSILEEIVKKVSEQDKKFEDRLALFQEMIEKTIKSQTN